MKERAIENIAFFEGLHAGKDCISGKRINNRKMT